MRTSHKSSETRVSETKPLLGLILTYHAPEKKNLIVAGVTTDVCLVPPALSMQGEGFHIKVESH